MKKVFFLIFSVVLLILFVLFINFGKKDLQQTSIFNENKQAFNSIAKEMLNFRKDLFISNNDDVIGLHLNSKDNIINLFNNTNLSYITKSKNFILFEHTADNSKSFAYCFTTDIDKVTLRYLRRNKLEENWYLLEFENGCIVYSEKN